MQAIILCGGLGTRLRTVVSDVPKTMAPINGKPFMMLQVEKLIKLGVNKIVFAVGYKKDIIRNFFGEEYKGVKIIYSEEEKPLFTGGAMKQALSYIDEDDVVVMNGDIWVDVDLNAMMQQHKDLGAWVTIAVKPMSNFCRYGNVILAENGVDIVDFIEKKPTEHGNVNLGVYIVKRNIFDDLPELGDAFSFENDYLTPNIKNRMRAAFRYDGYWIDIGVPEDYASFIEYYSKNYS